MLLHNIEHPLVISLFSSLAASITIDFLKEIPLGWRRVLKISICVFFVLLLSGCLAASPAYEPVNNWRQDGYEEAQRKVDALARDGTITRIEANREMISIARTYFPNDPLLIGAWEQVYEVSARYGTGELTKEAANAQIGRIWERFDAANIGRHAEVSALEEQRRKQQATGRFLQGIGAGLQKATPSANSINCTSYRIGSQVNSNCN